MDVVAGSTDISTYFKLRLAADGLGAIGLTIADLDLQYVRSGSAPAAKVDAIALAATDSAHADNRAIEIDATDQPGLYRVDWPDAAFAAGAREVILTVKHTSIFSEDLRVNLTPVPANLLQINSLSALLSAFARSAGSIVLGTASGTPTTTVIPTSSLSPAAVDTNQFVGRVLIFAGDTTTAGLRGQGAAISSMTSGGQITLAAALSQAPVSGDTFVIL